MSASSDLEKKVMRLRSELETAQDKWHEALLAEFPYKVGDVVDVVTPNVRYEWDFELKAIGKPTQLPDTIECGRVRCVYVQYDFVRMDDFVRMEIAPQLKGGGFHARNSICIPYGSTIRKREPTHHREDPYARGE